MRRRLAGVALALALVTPGAALAKDDTCATARVARVVRVVDGDTFDADVSLRWLQVTITLRERVRVLGVDAWELRDGERGQAARAFAARWLAEAGAITLRACRRDAFGRALADATNAKGERLADALIAAGHGVRR